MFIRQRFHHIFYKKTSVYKRGDDGSHHAMIVFHIVDIPEAASLSFPSIIRKGIGNAISMRIVIIVTLAILGRSYNWMLL